MASWLACGAPGWRPSRLGALIAARFAELTVAAATELLAAAPVAYARVNTAQPQLAARGRWHRSARLQARCLRSPRPAWSTRRRA